MACGSQPQGYTIKGTLTGDVEGKTIYLCRNGNVFDLKGIDSTVVRNGQFELKGSVNTPQLYILKYFADSSRTNRGERGMIQRPIIPLMIENGVTEITACVDSLNTDLDFYSANYDYSRLSIKSTPLQQMYMDYKKEFAHYAQARMENSMKFYSDARQTNGANRAQSDAFVKRQDSIARLSSRAMAEIVEQNKDNMVGVLALKECFGQFDAATLERLIAAFPAELKAGTEAAPIFAKADTVKNCAPGAQFIDIDLLTPDGTPFRLSEYVGKGNYTLVEFWASWCGPCRGEIPHLKHVYNLYHKDGFNIVSISMDEKKEAWLKAIEEEDMNWVQASDLKAFEGDLHKLYNFNGIPHCVLIDPNGKIVDNNARGPQLDNFLVEFYGDKFEKDYLLYKKEKKNKK